MRQQSQTECGTHVLTVRLPHVGRAGQTKPRLADTVHSDITSLDDLTGGTRLHRADHYSEHIGDIDDVISFRSNAWIFKVATQSIPP